MKVLHVIPSLGPARGGPSEAALAMTRALNSSGIQADIVATNDNGAGLLPVTTGIWQPYEGVRVCFLPRWSPRPSALREFQYARGFHDWLADHLPAYDGVHVHALFSYLSTKAMAVCRKHRKPFVVRPLGLLDPWSLSQKAVKKQLYYRLIEKRNLQAARAVHCTSAVEAGNVRTLLPQARVEVIPHGIEALEPVPDAPRKLRQKWHIAADCKVILFLSRWHLKKNIPLLLESLQSMKDESWTLLLAGSADAGYEQEVLRAIDRLELQDRVICPGHVRGEDKNLLLNGADLFVLPSISENFGVAVAEALCCGLPCVVTEGVDLAPVVAELSGGFRCTADPGSLTSALRQGLHATFDRQRLRADAQKRFSWDASAARLRALYASVFT